MAFRSTQQLIRRALLALITAAIASMAAAQTTPTPSNPAPAAAPAAQPAAPTATPTPMQASKPRTEQVENPYGFIAMIKHSDAVGKAVLVLLVIMSMGTWYIMATKIIEQAKMLSHAKEATKKFWKAGSVRQGADVLPKTSPFRFIAEAGHDATQKHDGLLGQIALNDWVTLSIQRATERVQGRLQEGLAFLGTVGSTSPFIGLFGTVWGILNALTAIGVAGQASIDKVAGPVGEALIMTAIGLAVAVPAVLGYNWLIRRNKAVMDEVRAFGSDLHAVLLAQSAKRA